MADGFDTLGILKRYWGYECFRSIQPDIINSVLEGHDTLGLMPTGGGKSITFQVPAIALPGLTVVVTPLISLMKDQVDNLRDRGIKAVYLHSGLTRAEHNLALDRCRLGKVKILYISPEKLISETFMMEIGRFDVSLIVVDEAHCISQWGYDFRPSYLRIASLRKLFPEVPVLALTASATPRVADDIMERLEFRPGSNKFALSFDRPNLSYVVRQTDSKDLQLVRILNSVGGCGIVYVRSRKRTREIARLLCDEGISADFYHAGLDPAEKDLKQNRWKDNTTRIMVATNAFGMGIDKPDVRIVCHYDLPSSLEEYYQEAGRGGRDGQHSIAVALVCNRDKAVLSRRLTESFPDKDTIKRVYELAGNFLEVPVGSGYNTLYEFNFGKFCDTFNLNPNIARNSLMILSRAGYIDYSDEVTTRSRVMILMEKSALYSLRLPDIADRVLTALLRTYTGLFSDYITISEGLLASALQLTDRQIYEAMLLLSREKVLHYVPRRTSPNLIYTTSRELPKHILIGPEVYDNRRDLMEQRIEAVKRFAFGADKCRVRTLLEYFGENPQSDCGTCDVCRARRRAAQPITAADSLADNIVRLASQPGGHTPAYISRHLDIPVERVINAARPLIDNGTLAYLRPQGILTLPTRK
ncbi:MAG: RecQ family ATP-dependent DNA helicase [Paramuribaculum sp.]|nr:RecQ family ATP-dependent DNA helicase [Paramuribaculum sp.]